MQQIVVPQFIDVEDKIIGPITVRQFLILLVGAGICFVAYKLSDFTLFVIELAIIGFITLIVAFVKINGMPIHYLLLNFIQTMKRARIRVWNKMFEALHVKKDQREGGEAGMLTVPVKPRIGNSRLAELSLIVDTGGVYSGEKESL